MEYQGLYLAKRLLLPFCPTKTRNHDVAFHRCSLAIASAFSNRLTARLRFYFGYPEHSHFPRTDTISSIPDQSPFKRHVIRTYSCIIFRFITYDRQR